MGTSDVIRLINRDELSHVVIFQHLLKEIRNENPDFFNDEGRELYAAGACCHEVENGAGYRCYRYTGSLYSLKGDTRGSPS